MPLNEVSSEGPSQFNTFTSLIVPQNNVIVVDRGILK